MGLFWATLQNWRRALHCLGLPRCTFLYVLFLVLFLYALAAPDVSIFGLLSELKTAIFWPILHVSLRAFHGLRHILYTSRYIYLFFSIFAWFGSLSCFVFWPFYRSKNCLILAHYSYFIKGLSWFEAYYIQFVLYLSFGHNFCIIC